MFSFISNNGLLSLHRLIDLEVLMPQHPCFCDKLIDIHKNKEYTGEAVQNTNSAEYDMNSLIFFFLRLEGHAAQLLREILDSTVVNQTIYFGMIL